MLKLFINQQLTLMDLSYVLLLAQMRLFLRPIGMQRVMQKMAC
jgi:hypothetical protein